MHSSHVKTQSCISVSTTACCYNLPHSDCYFSSVLSCTFLISYTTSGHLYFYNNPVHILTCFQYILNPFKSFYTSCLFGLNWTSATQLYHTLMLYSFCWHRQKGDFFCFRFITEGVVVTQTYWENLIFHPPLAHTALKQWCQTYGQGDEKQPSWQWKKCKEVIDN